METAKDITTGLMRAQSAYDPKTTSLMLPGRGQFNVSSEPFKAGFLDGVEERAILSRLLRLLDERSVKLMLHWYVEQRPVTDIARRLHVSRVHCYRMRNKALSRMVAALREEAESSEPRHFVRPLSPEAATA
jgi:DNA-directed RNA polymerase specialized sigma24 family protein